MRGRPSTTRRCRSSGGGGRSTRIRERKRGKFNKGITWRLRRIILPLVAHLFEPAATGRSKCRGCARPIQRGELRFGERVPNVFGEGETTLWFHPLCAAYKRPQPMLEALAGTTDSVPDREGLERAALGSVAHELLRGIDDVARSPSAQPKGRRC